MLKRLGKHFEKCLIKIINTLFSILAILYFSNWFNKSKCLAKNKECFVLGNGPSLKSDLFNLKANKTGKSIMCVNDFSLSKEFNSLQPSYYLLLDPYYWEENLSKENYDIRTNVYRNINSFTSWKLKLVVPFEMKKFIKNNKTIFTNPNIKFCYYNRTPISGFNSFVFWCFKNNLGLPSAQNVLVAALIFLINMGFKKIYIYGADNSLHEQIKIDDNNVVLVGQQHFYDDSNEVKKKTYSRSYIQHKPINMSELFEIWSKAFENYLTINDYSEKTNVKIFNLSSKSYIDAFKRK